MLEEGGVNHEKAVNWLEPIGLQDDAGNIEPHAVILADPRKRDDTYVDTKSVHKSPILPTNAPRREMGELTNVLIPPDTPRGSLIVATSPRTEIDPETNLPKIAKEPIIQLFRVVEGPNGSSVLFEVSNNAALGLKDVILNELPVGQDKVAFKKRQGTRKLTPDYAHKDQLDLPKIKQSDSLCQRLPSQSNRINLALITDADLTAYRSRVAKITPASWLRSLSTAAPATLTDIARVPAAK